MKVKDKVRIECLKQGKTLTYIANQIGITRFNYYFHLNKGNKEILKKTEEILGLKPGFFEDNTEN